MNDAFEQSLIVSAKADGMRPEKKRALVASLAGAATLGVAGTAKAATTAAAAKKTATLALVKWLAVCVTGTALVAGGTTTALQIREHERARAERAAQPVNPPAPMPAPVPVRLPETGLAEPTALSPADLPSVPATPARPATKPAPAPTHTIAEELRVIDRARVALSSNDVASADAALAEHARTFPNGAFADEARVLRIDVLAKRGDKARAASLARAYLAAHPDSPYAERLGAYVEAAP